MKGFVFKILIIFIPILLAFGLLEYSLLNSSTSYHYKHQQLEIQKDSIEILFFGNSHIFEGIDPKFMDQCSFNLANSGQDLYTDYHLLKTYINELSSLRKVVISVSYNSLFSEFSYGKTGYERAYFYNDIYDIPTQFESYLDPKRYSLVFRYGLKKATTKLFSNQKNAVTEKGYNVTKHKQKNLNSITDTNFVKNNLEKYHSNMAHNRLKRNQQHIENMIKLADKKGVEVVLITAPTYLTYYNNIDRKYFAEMKSSIETIKTKYDIIYYNFLDDSDFVITDFRNANHLCNDGAKRFTKKINQLLSPSK